MGFKLVEDSQQQEVAGLKMDFDGFFQKDLDVLHEGGNYRVFAELERKAGKFPKAARHACNSEQEVTVWCSNDYLPHLYNPSHIIPVPVGDAAKCKWISDLLLDNYGIYLQPINYPTVPKGTERLRITPTPLHSNIEVKHLVSALDDLWSQCALSSAVA